MEPPMLTASELVELITENLPDLMYADPAAKMRLRLMSMGKYVNAGYYKQCIKDEEVVLNNVNGEMKDFHIDNMVSTILKNNGEVNASGYYFITRTDNHNEYNYSHYCVTG